MYVKHTPPTQQVQMLISSTQQYVWLIKKHSFLPGDKKNHTSSTDSYTAYIQNKFVGCMIMSVDPQYDAVVVKELVFKFLNVQNWWLHRFRVHKYIMQLRKGAYMHKFKLAADI